MKFSHVLSAALVATTVSQAAVVVETEGFGGGGFWSALSPASSIDTSSIGNGTGTVNQGVSATGSVVFNQFDASLGTLTQVDIEVTTSGSTFSYSFAGNATRHSATIGSQLSLSDALPNAALGGSESVSPASVSVGTGSPTGAALGYSASVSDSLGLSDFVGNGTYSLTLQSLYNLSLTKNASGNHPASLGITSFGPTGSVQLTYTYTPVPEPETYAMLAGLGLVGFGIYRRSRRA